MLHEQLKTGKLSLKTKLGYGMGQVSETIPLSIIYSFFVYFLTDVAHINPAVAGTISLFAIGWDAISDVVVGYLSDNAHTKWGRRRPFMAFAIIPFSICFALMFTDVDMSSSAKGVYFWIIATLVWTFMTIYVLPYMSLGAEITQDPDERNGLVKYRGVIAQVGMLICMPLPTFIEATVINNGGTASRAWAITGLIFGIVLFIGLFCAWKFTKGHELIVKKDKNEKRKKENILKAFASTFKYKSWLVILFLTFVMAWTTNLLQGGPIYLMSSNMGLSGGQQSIYFAAMPAAMIFIVPLIMQVAKKIGNRKSLAGFLVILGVVVSLFRFIPFTNMAVLLIYGIIGNTLFFAFLNIYFMLIYECCELDEFVTGKRREGTLTSCNYFFSKMGAATATWFLGLYLAYIGYDGTAAVQIPSALEGIMNFCTIIPGILGIVAGLSLILYPINSKNYKSLLTALNQKRLGEKYSIDEFEEILPKKYVEDFRQGKQDPAVTSD